MTRDARYVMGITLLTVPTIVYGGLTILGILTNGGAGLPGPSVTPLQQSLFRAGHAHAGVLVILSLVLQIALDHARLAVRWGWAARLGVPLAAILVSGGFFGLAYSPGFSGLLYGGAALVAYATLATGIGLLRAHAP